MSADDPAPQTADLSESSVIIARNGRPGLGNSCRGLRVHGTTGLPIGAVAAQIREGAPMNQWLLWSRFAAINLFGAAGLALAWLNGWIETIVQADSSRICILIFLLFLAGLIATAWRIEKVTAELDNIERGRGGRLDAFRRSVAVSGNANAIRALELRLFGRIAFIRQIGNALVMLGLIGTVVGFVMALNGVDAGRASDAGAIGSMVGSMIRGMGVALYTTLVGSVLNLWLTANYQLLATGTANLAAALIDAGVGGGPDGGSADAIAAVTRPQGAQPGMARVGLGGPSAGTAGGTAHV